MPLFITVKTCFDHDGSLETSFATQPQPILNALHLKSIAMIVYLIILMNRSPSEEGDDFPRHPIPSDGFLASRDMLPDYLDVVVTEEAVWVETIAVEALSR